MAGPNIPQQGDPPDEEFYPEIVEPRVGHDRSTPEKEDEEDENGDKKNGGNGKKK